MTERVFTVPDVDALIPQLEQCLRRVVELRAWMRAVYARLDASGLAPDDIDFAIPDDVAPAERSDLEDLKLGVRQLRDDVALLLGRGCVVRSLDSGLVDFRARHVDRDIYLCWKLGEPRLLWWHELDEGFLGRKPVDLLPETTLYGPGGRTPDVLLH